MEMLKMSKSSRQSSMLDDGMTFIGIIFGLIVGAVAMLFQLKNRGAITRKNITQFGAGTIEEDISESLSEAKRLAHQRAKDD